MAKPGIVITGVGLATPLGSDFATFAANLLAGKSAAREVIDVQAGVEVRLPICTSDDPPVPAAWSVAEFQALPRSERFVLWCASSALRDAGYGDERDGLRIGLILGSGGELLRRWEGNWAAGGREVYEGRTDSPTLAENAMRQLKLNGPGATVAAACASANYAIAQARRWIELGLADVCLAGAVETVTPICRSAFNNLRAL